MGKEKVVNIRRGGSLSVDDYAVAEAVNQVNRVMESLIKIKENLNVLTPGTRQMLHFNELGDILIQMVDETFFEKGGIFKQ